MFGPDDDPRKFVTQLVRALVRNDATFALTQGQQRLDFVYVDDVVSALQRLTDVGEHLPFFTHADVGVGTAVELRAFAELAHKLSGARTLLRFGDMPYRAREPMLTVADTETLRGLGWRPMHSLAYGLAQTIDAERRRTATAGLSELAQTS
jgi:nucleoside-diphosphate-sugar epimerase